MKKLMKNKSLIAMIAAVLIIVAVLVIPKLTGKSLGELISGLFGENSQSQTETNSEPVSNGGTNSHSDISSGIDENGVYTSKDEVALYIHTYGKLPQNFITKAKAQELGWEGGPLWDYAPGKSIGGDVFSNREGLLPKKDGRKWYECDIDYDGGSRGAKRIVFSNDGLIYYTEDHYESYTQLY